MPDTVLIFFMEASLCLFPPKIRGLNLVKELRELSICDNLIWYTSWYCLQWKFTLLIWVQRGLSEERMSDTDECQNQLTVIMELQHEMHDKDFMEL